jgi:hypothetical protein
MLAAVRDFDSGNVSNGSFAAQPIRARQRHMSASLQYRTCQCVAVEPPLRAKTGLMHCSKTPWLFDHLIGPRD